MGVEAIWWIKESHWPQVLKERQALRHQNTGLAGHAMNGRLSAGEVVLSPGVDPTVRQGTVASVMVLWDSMFMNASIRILLTSIL